MAPNNNDRKLDDNTVEILIFFLKKHCSLPINGMGGCASSFVENCMSFLLPNIPTAGTEDIVVSTNSIQSAMPSEGYRLYDKKDLMLEDVSDFEANPTTEYDNPKYKYLTKSYAIRGDNCLTASYKRTCLDESSSAFALTNVITYIDSNGFLQPIRNIVLNSISQEKLSLSISMWFSCNVKISSLPYSTENCATWPSWSYGVANSAGGTSVIFNAYGRLETLYALGGNVYGCSYFKSVYPINVIIFDKFIGYINNQVVSTYEA